MMPDAASSHQLDSLTLLFRALHSCRHASPSFLKKVAQRLRLLEAILSAAQERNAFVVPVESVVLDEIHRTFSNNIVVHGDGTSSPGTGLCPAQQDELGFIRSLIAELARLAEDGNTQVVRDLGYQFHNACCGLLNNQPHDRDSAMWFLHFAAGYWDELSVEMRAAFCKIARVDPHAAGRLVRSKGFAYGRLDY
jgi:hypothetical protein